MRRDGASKAVVITAFYFTYFRNNLVILFRIFAIVFAVVVTAFSAAMSRKVLSPASSRARPSAVCW